MKKFRFRLEKVLQYRQIVRQEKKRELALRLAEMRVAEEKLEELLEAQAQIDPEPDAAVDVSQFLLRGQYRARLKTEIENQRLTVKEAEERVAEARVAYVEAGKEARALEMLKERQQAKYLEYIGKEEEKGLDEMVTQRHVKKA